MFNRDRVFRLVRPRGERGRVRPPPRGGRGKSTERSAARPADRHVIFSLALPPPISSLPPTLPRVPRACRRHAARLYKISPRGGGRALMNYRVRAARSLKLHGEPRGAP
jgi:hypothetical protein